MFGGTGHRIGRLRKIDCLVCHTVLKQATSPPAQVRTPQGELLNSIPIFRWQGPVLYDPADSHEQALYPVQIVLRRTLIAACDDVLGRKR
jgi:hypothetical protein